jgi:hypothetical protein
MGRLFNLQAHLERSNLIKMWTKCDKMSAGSILFDDKKEEYFFSCFALSFSLTFTRKQI